MAAMLGILRQLRTADYATKGRVACLLLLFLIALILRLSLVKAQTWDFLNFFKPWMDYLSLHGIKGFGTNFSNYNTPYLFLMYIGVRLHISFLLYLKLLSIFFDFVLALAVGLIVQYFRPKDQIKYQSSLAILFLPMVIIDSSLWGQSDSIYVAFCALSFYACLKNRSNWAWVWWGLAFAFKLQAIFFLPFLIFMFFHRRWNLYGPALTALLFVALSALPIFEGRSVSSTFSIYLNQTQVPVGFPLLSINAPTIYQFIPQTNFVEYFRRLGIFLAAAAATGIVGLAFVRKKFQDKELLTIMVATVFAIPFLLPYMHERYFYLAEVMSLTLAFVRPGLAWIFIAMQVVTIMDYTPYLSVDAHMPAFPAAVLSLVVLGILFTLTKSMFELPAGSASSETVVRLSMDGVDQQKR
jgi:Gpi18-like mannosyltransferase